MHYYQFNIADFNNATRHLTRLERSIYRDLIDLYYDTEKPLDLDLARLGRRIVVDEQDLASVEQVLNEFFTKSEHGWVNDRCDADIAAYHAKHEKAVKAGKASAKARKSSNTKPSSGSEDSEHTLSKCSTDVQPTNNHKPITNNQSKEVAAAPVFNFKQNLFLGGADYDDIDNWMAVRKKKKAVNSERAYKTFLAEVRKAGITVREAVKICSAKQWKGFEASWLANEQQKKPDGFIDRHQNKDWANGL